MDDIKVLSEEITLVCPLSQKLIDDAVKGEACTHLACFDKSSFENLQQKKCPVCAAPVNILQPSLNMQRVLEHVKHHSLDLRKVDSKFIVGGVPLQFLKACQDAEKENDYINLSFQDDNGYGNYGKSSTTSRKVRKPNVVNQSTNNGNKSSYFENLNTKEKAKVKSEVTGTKPKQMKIEGTFFHVKTLSKPKSRVESIWKDVNLSFRGLDLNARASQPDKAPNNALEESIYILSRINTLPKLKDLIHSNEVKWPPCHIRNVSVKWNQIMGGIRIYFPFRKPLTPQLQMMSKIMSCLKRKEHALIESPTGTGKTAALLCSTLAWQRHHDLLGWSDFGGKPVRIIYCSRTHSQVKQASKDLKTMPYRPTMTVLGSRKKLCVNEEIQQSGGHSRACAMKVARKECSHYTGLKNPEYAEALFQHCRPKSWKISASSVDASDDPGGVIDIEDLQDVGVDHGACPWYSAKSLANTAQLIFCPYQYILDPSIRQRVLGAESLSHSVIVLDEAHNIERVLVDAGSAELDLCQLMKIVQDLCVIHSHSDWEFESSEGKVKMSSLAGKLMVFVERIVQGLIKARENFEITRADLEIKKMGKFGLSNKVAVHQFTGVVGNNGKKPQPPDSLIEKRQLVEELRKTVMESFEEDPTEFEAISSSLRRAQLDVSEEETLYKKVVKKHSGTLRFFEQFNIDDEILLQEMNQSYQELRIGIENERKNRYSDRPTSSVSVNEHLPLLLAALMTMYHNPYEYTAVVEAFLNIDEQEEPFHSPADFSGFQRHCCLDQITTKYKHGKYLKLRSDDPPKWRIRVCLWLMRPAIMFEEIAQKAHSVILTSGTLFPMSPWELGKTLVKKIKRNESRLNHVIKPNQVLITPVPWAPNGRNLDGTYRNIKSMKEGAYESMLGQTILQLAERVDRGGCIVFLPSYSKIKQCKYHWRENGILERFRRLRGPVIFEPSGKETSEENADFTDCDQARKQYVEYVEQNKSPVMIAVYRGKMSEGVDFKDDFCRAVFCCGIPYPSANDNRIFFKKRWNSDIQKNENPSYLSGDAWYRQQAYRALNQAIDSRFSQNYNLQSSRSGISKWAAKLIRNEPAGGFQELLHNVSVFFQAIPTSVRLGEEPLTLSQGGISQGSFTNSSPIISSQKRRFLQSQENGSPSKLSKASDILEITIL